MCLGQLSHLHSARAHTHGRRTFPTTWLPLGHVFTHSCLLFEKDHRTSFLVQATHQINAMLASFTFELKQYIAS